jgi:alpha-mannosidase
MRADRNNVNKFPHSTFNWVGIDGTQVLCHMTPVGTSAVLFSRQSLADSCMHPSDTYNAQATVEDISKALTNHKVCLFLCHSTT